MGALLIHTNGLREGQVRAQHPRNSGHARSQHFAALSMCLLAALMPRSISRAQTVACCLVAGACADLEHDTCISQPGEPYPPGTACATTVCVPPAFVQGPEFGSPPTAGCLNAWGELSAFASVQLTADNFVLNEDAAIAEIHWWGGYQNWLGVTAPQPAPDQFQIAVWSHIAAFEGNPSTQFDRPGTLLRSWVVDRAAVNETFVACSLDALLQTQFGASFRYAWSIAQPDRFVALSGTTYWLSIAAVYGDIACPCDADVAAPAGVYDTADVDFIAAQIGCPVGTGDADCDAADANCNGVVDSADQTLANCQRVAAFADPGCCYVVPDTVWGWTVRPLVSSSGAVRVQNPTAATDGASFGVGEAVTDTGGVPWDAAFALATTPTNIVAPAAPLAEASGIDGNRYLGFRAPASWTGASLAIRVRLVSLDRFSGFDGETRWVAPPGTFIDDQTQGSTFLASALQCQPVFATWSSSAPVFIYGPEVVPLSSYGIQAVDVSCQGDLGNEACYSPPLTGSTAKWGDIVTPFGGGAQPDFRDISAVVDKFQGVAAAVPKTRAQLQPNVPNPGTPVDFRDISAAVDAFQAAPYPFTGPQACP